MVELTLPRVKLLLPGSERAEQMAAYMRANQAHLEPWAPPRPDTVSQAWFWRERLAEYQRSAELGRSLRLVLIDLESDDIIGTIGLTNIMRGPFQACHLGYALDHRFEGQGLMTESLRAVIAHAFDSMLLHRIMANYLPENTRSERLLERLGFEREGMAKRYLFIAGAWRDCVLTSLTSPRDDAPPL